MPLNDVQYHAFERWIRNPNLRREKLDFIWDGLNAGQKTALKNRVKADLDAEFDATSAAVAARKEELTGTL